MHKSHQYVWRAVCYLAGILFLVSLVWAVFLHYSNTQAKVYGSAQRQIKQAAASINNSCVIASDNKAYCWGIASGGRLGNGTTSPEQTTPVAVSQGAMPAGATIRQISVGSDHTCVIASDNLAYCWGEGTNGELGNGTTTASQTTPVAVSQGAMPAGATIRQISVGSDHTCALASDNQVYCWGVGTNGRLGNGSTASQTTPGAVQQGLMPAGATIRQIANGNAHTCAIASDNQAYCWGRGAEAQLGNGLTNNYASPRAVSQGAMPAGATILQITAGYNNSCVIASDNKAYCWGAGSNGQLGNGTTTASQTTPVAVSQGAMPAGATIRQITSGYNVACAIASNNQAYCWGFGANGRLGNGGTSDQTTPVAVSSIDGMIEVSQSVFRAYGPSASTSPGSPLAGDNTPAVLSTIASDFRLRIGLTNLEHIKSNSISGGDAHACAIASNNQAYCWGAGANGRLGNGGTSDATTPVAVSQGAMPAGATIRQITSGDSHTCVVASDNKAYCWGAGANGRLGNGGTGDQTTPVAVSQGAMPAGATIRQIVAAGTHTCAIASDNKAYCWGYGVLGALGNGATGDQTTPVAVSQGAMPAGATVLQIAAGSGHTCAIASDNKAYCWGAGSNGRLGNGDINDATTPVAVSQGAMEDASSTIGADDLALELQVAPLGAEAVCSAVSTGWENITTTTAMSWGISPPTHTTAIGAFGSDPAAPTSGGYAYQSIVQSGSFTNDQAIAPQQTGLWDVVLHDRSSRSATDYCFRMVSTTSGTAIDTYSQYPHITTATGSLGVQFVDSGGTPIVGTAADTPFASQTMSTSAQVSSGELLTASGKQLEIYNSLTNSGWGVSLAATDGPTARWESGAQSYDYNDDDAGVGSQGTMGVLFKLPPSIPASSFTAHGTAPDGTACSSTGITLPTETTLFSSTVSAITLLTGNPSSQFNCRWRLKDVMLQQVIPAGQPVGTYVLDMTATIVAN